MKPVPLDIVIALRRHFHQDVCNEDPQSVIDQYEEDRRRAAIEIVALRKRLAALYAHDPLPVYDETVVPMRRR